MHDKKGYDIQLPILVRKDFMKLNETVSSLFGKFNGLYTFQKQTGARNLHLFVDGITLSCV
jgi:hypothetical protein